ncbi:hypothetical protein [Streptomyces pseudogriseolus]|uniref:hypothetical protein n=1 Tax=Streptomyces pseudogriseolus TaxID=36817 RepID=UPI003FA2782C
MIVVYTPAGGEPEHYDASTLRVSEASIVQRTVDMKWQDILQGLERDDLDAMRGVVWVLKKRSNPSLRFGEFDPGITEMTTRMDSKEIAAWLDNALAAVSSDGELTMEQIEQIILDRLPSVAVDPDHARELVLARTRAPKDPAPAPEPEAQDAPGTPDPNPSPTSNGPETATSDSSPISSTSHPEMSTT